MIDTIMRRLGYVRLDDLITSIKEIRKMLEEEHQMSDIIERAENAILGYWSEMPVELTEDERDLLTCHRNTTDVIRELIAELKAERAAREDHVNQGRVALSLSITNPRHRGRR